MNNSKWVKVNRKSLKVFIDHFYKFNKKSFYLKQKTMARCKIVIVDRVILEDLFSVIPEVMPSEVKDATDLLKGEINYIVDTE